MNIFTVVAEDDSDFEHSHYYTLCAFVKEQDAMDWIELKKVQQLEEKLNTKKLAEFHHRWLETNPCPGMQSQIIDRNPPEVRASYIAWLLNAITAQADYARSLKIEPPPKLVVSDFFTLKKFHIQELPLHGL